MSDVTITPAAQRGLLLLLLAAIAAIGAAQAPELKRYLNVRKMD